MIVASAMVLDALIGDPKWLWSKIPHPITLIGRLIGWVDRRFNCGPNRRAHGVLLVVALLIGSIGIGFVPHLFSYGWVLEIALGAILIAQRSLVSHVKEVATQLAESIEKGQLAVSMIVGRDTKDMNETAVTRAAIESAAENLSDGVIAPVFWFTLAGLPGLIAYKAINTADSMVGYLTDRHRDFGWAAARLDDVLNWAPARITAGLISLCCRPVPELAEIQTDARKHRSPNAGWPEAAMSRALGIALSGPRTYHGVLEEHAYVNEHGRKDVTPADIDTCITVLWQAWRLTLAALLVWAAIQISA